MKRRLLDSFLIVAIVLAAMYSTPGMFVVRADSPYRSIEDLKGHPVAFGARGSGLIILARYVLDGLGLDRDGTGWFGRFEWFGWRCW